MRINQGLIILSFVSVIALSGCSSTDSEITPEMVDESISAPAQQVMDDALSYKSLSTASVEIYDLDSGSPYVPDIYSAVPPTPDDANLVKERFDDGSVTVYPIDAQAFHYGGGTPLLASEMIKMQQQYQQQQAEQAPPPLLPMSEAAEPFASPFDDNGMVRPGMPQSMFLTR